VITPFDDALGVDEAALERHADDILAAGATGIVDRKRFASRGISGHGGWPSPIGSWACTHAQDSATLKRRA
jgi:hypothetical protein